VREVQCINSTSVQKAIGKNPSILYEVKNLLNRIKSLYGTTVVPLLTPSLALGNGDLTREVVFHQVDKLTSQILHSREITDNKGT